MVDLVRRLREQNVQFEQIVFPDEVHDFLLHRDWLRAYHAESDFFDKHLKVKLGCTAMNKSQRGDLYEIWMPLVFVLTGVFTCGLR